MGAACQPTPLSGLSEQSWQEAEVSNLCPGSADRSDWVEERFVEVRESGLFYRLVFGSASEVSGLPRAGEKRAHGKRGLAEPLWAKALSVGDFHRPDVFGRLLSGGGLAESGSDEGICEAARWL